MAYDMDLPGPYDCTYYLDFSAAPDAGRIIRLEHVAIGPDFSPPSVSRCAEPARTAMQDACSGPLCTPTLVPPACPDMRGRIPCPALRARQGGTTIHSHHQADGGTGIVWVSVARSWRTYWLQRACLPWVLQRVWQPACWRV